jgi:hypothetical protein
VIYWFWWDKPFRVLNPLEIPIDTRTAQVQEDLLTLLRHMTIETYGERAWKTQNESRRIANTRFVSSTVEPRAFLGLPKPLWWSSILGTIFSGIHLIAWNWHFPTEAEKILWRTFSTATLVSCAISGVVCFIISQNVYRERTRRKLGYLLLFSLLTYSASRLVIIAQMFACFRRSPAGLYKTIDWSYHFF